MEGLINNVRGVVYNEWLAYTGEIIRKK